MKNEQKGALNPLNFLFIQVRGHLFDEKLAERCSEAIKFLIYSG